MDRLVFEIDERGNISFHNAKGFKAGFAWTRDGAHEVLDQWMRGELKADLIPEPLSNALTNATESNIKSPRTEGTRKG